MIEHRLTRVVSLQCASHVRAAETHDPAPAKMVQQLDLDVGVETALEDKKYHPRNHPGVLRSRADELPDSIVKAMEVVIEGKRLLTYDPVISNLLLTVIFQSLQRTRRLIF